MGKQYKITFDDGLRRQLDLASERNSQPLSDEIRSRLEWSVSMDLFDRPTQELGADVMAIAQSISQSRAWSQPFDQVEWHQHPVVFEAFKVAVLKWLETIKPAQIADQPELTLDPETLGRTTAHAHARFRFLRTRMALDTEEMIAAVDRGGSGYVQTLKPKEQK